MELETSFLVHQSISSSYIQQHSLMSIPSLLPIRSTITQPLPRPFRHLSLYAAQSPSHSHAYPVTCPHTWQNQPANHSPIPSLVHTRNKKNQLATLTPIPSLVHIRNKINQPLSCLVLPFPVFRQRVKFSSMQYLMLESVKRSRKAEMKGNLWMKKTIIIFSDLNMLCNSSWTHSTYCSTDLLTLKQHVFDIPHYLS